MASSPLAQIVGLHHIRIPVSDAWVSRDRYMTTLGFQQVLDLQDENGLIGVVLRHNQRFFVGLHRGVDGRPRSKDLAFWG